MTEIYVAGCCGVLCVPGSAHYDDILEADDADAVRDGPCPACGQRSARLQLIATRGGTL